MENMSLTVWMNLLGFDKNDPDSGAKRFLNTTGVKPDAICALLCHADFFNLHEGMEKEYVLPPDNCAYFGIPRNSERKRQEWTNYDLRRLVKNLAEEGVEFYAGIFGNTLKNAFHKEWALEHREVLRIDRRGEEGASGIFALKRLKDGSYYEDFFIDKVCKTLTDYGMTGIHLADGFCPGRGGMLHNMEFSTDFVDQFVTHSGITLPPEIMEGMGKDDKETVNRRADWIYRHKRAEWARFNMWRWEVFFRKLSSRLHAIGKKVSVLGMYCTDPFETIYCLGTDLKRIIGAGVDRITANILPTSVYFAGADDRPYEFHKYMAIAPTTAAHIGNSDKLISMVGVHDPTEEWSMIHHQPTLHERDLYTMMAYYTVDKNGYRRSLSGYMMCLGDGLSKSDWEWERVRMEAATSAKVRRTLSVAMLWSENANDRMLDEFIRTRRWTPHKHFYEITKHGEMLGATVTPDALDSYEGTILVPNLDMLTECEQKAVASYKGGAVICTVLDGFDEGKLGIKPEISFSDPYSNMPMRAFAFGKGVSEEFKEEIEALISVDDGQKNLPLDLLNVEEPDNTLFDTLVFSKVNEGFVLALTRLTKEMNSAPLHVDKPNIQLELEDGGYRVYIYNDSLVKYHHAFVKARKKIREVKSVSLFPVLPPRYINEATGALHHLYTSGETTSSFETKMQPGGVTILDVYID